MGGQLPAGRAILLGLFLRLLVGTGVAAEPIEPAWPTFGIMMLPDSAPVLRSSGSVLASASSSPTYDFWALLRLPRIATDSNPQDYLTMPLAEGGRVAAYFTDLAMGRFVLVDGAVDGDVYVTAIVCPDGSLQQWPPIRYDAQNQRWIVGDPMQYEVPGGPRKQWFVFLSYGSYNYWDMGGYTFVMYRNYDPIQASVAQFEYSWRLPPYWLNENPVPHLLQTPWRYIPSSPADPDWWPLVYDSCDYSLPWFSIAQKGCLLSSLAMVVGTHQPTNPNVQDPIAMNLWLKDRTQQVKRKEVPPPSPFIRRDVNLAVTPYLTGGALAAADADHAGMTGEDDAILYALWSYGPQILKVLSPRTGGDHFNVTLGKNVSGVWIVNDPHCSTREVPLNASGVGDGTYRGWRLVYTKDPPRPVGVPMFGVNVGSPVDLVLVDPLGRRTGWDSGSGSAWREIPHSVAETLDIQEDPDAPRDPTHRVLLEQAEDGSYEFRVTGTGDGEYNLVFHGADRTDLAFEDSVGPVPIAKGMVHTYRIDFSATDATAAHFSAAFSGKGQRPADVNEFLTYVFPTSARTELDFGATHADVTVLYDKAILPGSLTAVLDRSDVSGLFHPAPGAVEVVRLPLARGTNTLVLSVEGTLATGRTARDTDRMVFIVP